MHEGLIHHTCLILVHLSFYERMELRESLGPSISESGVFRRLEGSLHPAVVTAAGGRFTDRMSPEWISQRGFTREEHKFVALYAAV